MAINTYDEGLGATLKKLLPTILGIGAIIALVGLLFFGINYYLGEDTDGEVNSSNFIREYNYTMGNSDTNTTLVYIFDFQCPACKAVHPAFLELKDAFEGRVKFAYKTFPLPSHSFAKNAAYAAQAAGEQGRYFEFAEKIFEEDTNTLNNDTMDSIAEELELDIEAWKEFKNSSEVRDNIDQDIADIKNIEVPKSRWTNGDQINATPSFVIIRDDEIIDWWSGAATLETMQSRLDEVL